jgi:hypothetical protein
MILNIPENTDICNKIIYLCINGRYTVLREILAGKYDSLLELEVLFLSQISNEVANGISIYNCVYK